MSESDAGADAPITPLESDAEANGPQEDAWLSKPFGEGLVLAGFLKEAEALSRIPSLTSLPANARAEISRRFGASEDLEAWPRAGMPDYFRVVEPEVLNLLRSVSSALPADLENLKGFEWVEIAPLIAGHYVTRPLNYGAALPSTPTPEQIARTCMLSFGGAGPGQLHAGRHGNSFAVVSGTPLNLVPEELQINRFHFVVRYALQPRIDPIRVLAVNGRTIAIAGLERLVYLVERGVDRALCAISYGYGTDVLSLLPTVPQELLYSDRPPLVADFLDTAVAAPLPVRHPITIVRFQHDVLDIGSGLGG